jgi:hypothetical protein
VDNEIKTLRRVTDHAQKADDGGRIVRMAEVIYPNSEQFSFKTAFDNVAIVLKPMTPQTLGNLVGTRNSRARPLGFLSSRKGQANV